MAILLGAFLIMGLHPGPDMLTKHLAVTYSMVWTLVIANVITVIACLALLPYLALVTRIRGSLIIPFLLLLVFVGSYTANRQLADLLVTLAFGAVGYLMVRFGWPRAPLVLGFVLGKLAETYLFISMARYGYGWLTQPLVLVLIALTALVIVFPYLQERRAPCALAAPRCSAPGWPRRRLCGLYRAALAAEGGAVSAGDGHPAARARVGADGDRPAAAAAPEGPPRCGRWQRSPSWRGWRASSRSCCLLGFPLAVPLFIFAYLRVAGREPWLLSIALAAAAWGIFYLLFQRLLHFPFEAGLLIGGGT